MDKTSTVELTCCLRSQFSLQQVDLSVEHALVVLKLPEAGRQCHLVVGGTEGRMAVTQLICVHPIIDRK